MATTDQNDEIFAGDNRSLNFALKDDSGEAYNITDGSVEWVLRDGSGRPIISRVATITNPTGGLITVTLAPADTVSLASGIYFHGVNLSIEAGAYITMALGYLTIHPRVRTLAGEVQTANKLAEPVTLAEAKDYLKVEVDDDDPLIASLITAARILAEEYTRRKFITQAVEASFDYDELFEHGDHIDLIGPVASITSVKSYNDDDSETVMDPSHYRTRGDRIVLTADGEWPSDLRRYDCIIIEYVAGYGAVSDVPEPIKSAIKRMVQDMYDNRGDQLTGTISANVELTARIMLDPYKVYSL